MMRFFVRLKQFLPRDVKPRDVNMRRMIVDTNVSSNSGKQTIFHHSNNTFIEKVPITQAERANLEEQLKKEEQARHLSLY